MRVFDFIPEKVEDCKVVAWIHTESESSEMSTRKLPAVIICPGGGYEFVSEREGEPIAQVYYAAGYNTFVLNYSVGEKAKNLKPLCQLAATMAYVRNHAEEMCIDPEKIAVMGSSAGGHLACSLGTLFNTEQFCKVFASNENIRPNAMILLYPVIRSDKYAHVISMKNVSGSDISSEEYRWFGLDNHVDEYTPPTFLCHAADDNCVSVHNSIRMAEVLSNLKVPYELHILPNGGHGFSVCTNTVGQKNDYTGRWSEWSIQWLNKLFEFEL